MSINETNTTAVTSLQALRTAYANEKRRRTRLPVMA